MAYYQLGELGQDVCQVATDLTVSQLARLTQLSGESSCRQSRSIQSVSQPSGHHHAVIRSVKQFGEYLEVNNIGFTVGNH